MIFQFKGCTDLSLRTDLSIVIAAMKEVQTTEGQRIINQGLESTTRVRLGIVFKVFLWMLLMSEPWLT